ncbi:MAG: hypothetical protein ACUVQY_08525, partial [Thermoproteota archaeon]
FLLNKRADSQERPDKTILITYGLSFPLTHVILTRDSLNAMAVVVGALPFLCTVSSALNLRRACNYQTATTA